MGYKRNDNKLSILHLKTLIDNSGLTREEIAKQLDIGTSTVTQYYNGKRNLTIDALKKFSQFFNVSTDYLLGLSSVDNNNISPDLKAVSEYLGLDFRIVDSLKMAKETEDSDQTTYNAFLKQFLGDYAEKCKSPMAYDSNNVPSMIYCYLSSLKSFSRDIQRKESKIRLGDLTKDNCNEYLLYLYEIKEEAEKEFEKINNEFDEVIESFRYFVLNFCSFYKICADNDKKSISREIEYIKAFRDTGNLPDDLPF